MQLLLLFESTAGWVTGCAFTDAVTTVSGTLSASPKESPTVWLADVAIAVAFTIFAFGWLALAHVPSPKAGATSAYHDDAQKVQREVIEKDFLTEALSFAVGWGYIVSLRDVSYLLGRVLGRDSEGWTRMAQILIVLLVGTTLTLLLLLLLELRCAHRTPLSVSALSRRRPDALYPSAFRESLAPRAAPSHPRTRRHGQVPARAPARRRDGSSSDDGCAARTTPTPAEHLTWPDAAVAETQVDHDALYGTVLASTSERRNSCAVAFGAISSANGDRNGSVVSSDTSLRLS